MIVDRRGRVILFGGAPHAGEPSSEVLVFDSRDSLWRALPVEGLLPPPRISPAVVYDSSDDRLIVHGGLGSGGDLADLWILTFSGEGGTWQEVQLAQPAPPAASGHVLEILTSGDLILFYGAWSTVVSGTFPGPRSTMWTTVSRDRTTWLEFVADGLEPRVDAPFAFGNGLAISGGGEWRVDFDLLECRGE
jgi:hypothetical protein